MMEEHLSCWKTSLCGAKRKVEESAKEANLAEVAKGSTLAKERPSSCARLDEEVAMEEEAGDVVPP
jgi:hypothetical protein